MQDPRTGQMPLMLYVKLNKLSCKQNNRIFSRYSTLVLIKLWDFLFPLSLGFRRLTSVCSEVDSEKECFPECSCRGLCHHNQLCCGVNKPSILFKSIPGSFLFLPQSCLSCLLSLRQNKNSNDCKINRTPSPFLDSPHFYGWFIFRLGPGGGHVWFCVCYKEEIRC